MSEFSVMQAVEDAVVGHAEELPSEITAAAASKDI